MFVKDSYPIDHDAGTPYMQTFDEEYWGPGPFLEPYKNEKDARISDSVLIDRFGNTYTDSGVETQVQTVALLGEGTAFEASQFPLGSLVKTMYEAVTIRQALKNKPVEGGEYSARQIVGGFAVNYSHRHLRATYTQSTGLHFIMPAKSGEAHVARKISMKNDFKSGAFVTADEVDLGLINNIRAQINDPELFMRAERRFGWMIGQTYKSHVNSGDSMVRPKYTGYLRILRSEILKPVKTIQRKPDNKIDRVSVKNGRPVLGLHT